MGGLFLMNYCPECDVRISTGSDRCPLCHGEITREKDGGTTETYPRYEPMTRKRYKIILAVSAAAVFLILATVLINILTWKGRAWSAISSGYILYLWIFGLLTFNTRIHTGLKLVAHAAAITALLINTNALSGKYETLTKVSWAVSWGMPIIFFCFITAVSVIMLTRKRGRREYVFFQFSLCIFGLIPFIMVMFGMAKPVLPSIITAASSVLTIIAVTIFQRKVVTSEFKRKFHI